MQAVWTLGSKLHDELFDQRRLPCSCVTCNNDEALSGLDPISKCGERLLITRIDEEKSRVRRDLERRLCKSEVFVVHDFQSALSGSEVHACDVLSR